jgi:hypothetical protein
MFQYASMYAIAKAKGMRFVVPADLDLLKIFKLNVTADICVIQNACTHDLKKQCCALD